MGKTTFKDYICRPFCRFFREGEKETLACEGAKVAERLVNRGLVRPEQFLTLEAWNGLDDPLLAANICGPCPFRPADCDFRSQDRPGDATPCGGFIALILLRKRGLLRKKGLIGAQEVEEAICA